ncbi:MAG: potassium transporter Kup [Aquabacterium sp.]|uniref:potassium transporter Kup n=1 Tax=Aquabacterium sp. TaxID=1872578 RepID=UPI0012131CB5|nr:potassium transporter Kup [Aquabacterium sp.]TAK94943.1 MAG: potassium transporter Kup [Aquabacterium sp.]
MQTTEEGQAHTARSNPKGAQLAALTLGALGVVYGDIGTSPLYALKEVFNTGHAPLNHDNILGVLSMVFWTLTIVVSIKYVALVLKADNNGEGGTMALMALASSATESKPRLRYVLIVMGILGAALFYGDGVITPAISVLSAVEGLEIATPAFKSYIAPITLMILACLYAMQKHGTGAVGKFFGPITVIWFASLAGFGGLWVMRQPEVLQALNPYWAIHFGMERGWTTMLVLGSVFLAVTGAEALYADMGHFGKLPIQLAWYTLVFPALILNYFGQGALLLAKPEAVDNPFFLMVPGWALLPMVGLATIATVIASQATISGTFSVTKQAIQLGYLPRLNMVYTSVKEAGQIYIPSVNWMQFTAIVIAVGIFGSSSALATAYGIAVTATMVLTTLMIFFVMRYRWNYPWLLCAGSTGFFLVIELIFFSSNILKVLHGGWFTLMIAGFVFSIMLTWKRGRILMADALRLDAIDLPSFLDAIFQSPPTRVEGTAVFLNAEKSNTPNAMLHNLKHNKVLHRQNLFVTVRSHEIPWIPEANRVEIESLNHDCWQITLNFGFMDQPDVPQALKLLAHHGIEPKPMETSYFLSRDIVIPTIGSGMAPWREKLFASMHRNAADAAGFLSLPANRVVELGSKVEI